MAATTAFSSMGTAITVTISGTPTAIPGVKSIPLPETVWEFDEITNLGSDNNMEEVQPILKRGGVISFEMVWNPTNSAQAYLRSQHHLGTLLTFNITLSDSGSFACAFTAYVQKCQPVATNAKAQIANVELRVTGTVSDTP